MRPAVRERARLIYLARTAIGKPLRGGPAEPLDRLAIILGHAPAFGVHQDQVVLGLGKPLLMY